MLTSVSNERAEGMCAVLLRNTNVFMHSKRLEVLALITSQCVRTIRRVLGSERRLRAQLQSGCRIDSSSALTFLYQMRPCLVP